MSAEITWLGHASWLIDTGKHRILVDPFFTDNPAAPAGAKDLPADFILISHGHFDHVGDAAEIANRTGATIISNFEIAQWFSKKHAVKNTIGMNLGGGKDVPF